jgi:hypothetical protein
MSLNDELVLIQRTREGDKATSGFIIVSDFLRTTLLKFSTSSGESVINDWVPLGATSTSLAEGGALKDFPLDATSLSLAFPLRPKKLRSDIVQQQAATKDSRNDLSELPVKILENTQRNFGFIREPGTPPALLFRRKQS